MKRKVIFSLVLALCMTFTLAVPAYASSTEAGDPRSQGTTLKPGETGYNDPNDATWGDDSRGFATVTGLNDNDLWDVSGDDSVLEGKTDVDMENDEGADISIWARIIAPDPDDIVYHVEIE